MDIQPYLQKHSSSLKWTLEQGVTQECYLKGHSGAELHIYFLVHLESTPWSKKTGPPNTLSYNAIISQYSFNKFYEMIEEIKDCKQYVTHHKPYALYSVILTSYDVIVYVRNW